MNRKEAPKLCCLVSLSCFLSLTPFWSPWAAIAQNISRAPTAAALFRMPASAGSRAGSSIDHVSSIKQLMHSANPISQPLRPTNSAINLDLSSTIATLTSRNSTPISVLIGGRESGGNITGASSQVIKPGQLVTPAEYVAVFEALHGNQTLLLGPQANAIGGAFSLSSNYVQNLSSLTVPKNVTLDAIGFTSAKPLNVSGNINDYGSIFTLEKVPSAAASINATNVNIGSGALLSGQSESSNTRAISLYDSDGLNLNLSDSLVNNGSIVSSGKLSITAGGGITNQSSGNSVAQITANNVNLLSGSGSIVNSGQVHATQQLNLNTISPSTNLIVNNNGGVLEADGAASALGANSIQGTLNIRSAGQFQESANVQITGGSLSAPGGLDVYGKVMEVHVERINGEISNTGSVAHISVEAGNLTLGPQVLSGDPSYYNNAGDITISSITSVGGDLAIVASGNIITTGYTKIETITPNSSIFLSAGLNFSIGSGTNTTNFSTNSAGDSSNTLVFDGTRNAGMNINAAGNQLALSLDGAVSGFGGSDTGTITMVATGAINLVGGTVAAQAGNVLVITGSGGLIGNGTGGIASISTSTGNVTVASAQPMIVAGTSITNGTVSALPTPGATMNGALNLPKIYSVGGSIAVTSGGVVTAGGGMQAGAKVSITADTLNLGSIVASQIAINGITTNGSIANGTAMVITNAVLTSTSGNISIASAPGQDLVINGSGGFTCAYNQSVNITASTSVSRQPVLSIGAGNYIVSLGSIYSPGGLFNVSAPTVTMSSGAGFVFGIDYSRITIATGDFNGNPGQFILHYVGTSPSNVSESYPDPHSTLTIGNSNFNSFTIANSNGPVDLSQVSNLDLAGTGVYLAVLAESNIINSSGNPLTIDLSGGAGEGGSLFLAAGYCCQQSTNGQIGASGTNNITYTAGAQSSGSIELGTVNINTSGASGAGAVFVMANGGSVSLGTINDSSNCTFNCGGGVYIFGNGITTGPINASDGKASYGNVALGSVASTQGPPSVTNGIPSFLPINPRAPGTPSGVISVPSIVAGSLTITGGSVRGTLTTSIGVGAGNPGAVNTEVSFFSILVTSGSLNIVNTGNVAFGVLTPASLNFTDYGIVSASISAAGGINLACNEFVGGSPAQTSTLTTTNAPINISTDFITQPIINAGTGTVTISPLTPTNPINLGGGTGGLQPTWFGITAGKVVFGSSSSLGGINITGQLDMSSTPFTNGFQFIQGSGGSFTNNYSLNLGTNNLAISVGGAVTTGTITSSGSAISIAGSQVNFSNSLTTTGALVVSSDTIIIGAGTTVQAATIAMNGQTSNGSIAAGTNMTLNHSGALTSTVGGISVASAPGQDLVITGNGSGEFIAPASQSINFSASVDPGIRGGNLFLGPGNQSFIVGAGISPGGSVNFTANGSNTTYLAIQPGATYDFPNDFTAVDVQVGTFIGNPAQFTLHTTGHPNPDSTFNLSISFPTGTIANSSGSVDLSQLGTLSFSGQNIAIISAGNIINSSGNRLTIDISDATAFGGNLTLIAGFDFTPSTGGITLGPSNSLYSFTSPSSGGGSINLPNVSINTSGLGGGNVLAVANPGVTNDGSISLGTIITSGASGIAGSVTLIGNGITVGAINTTSTVPANSGQVSLISATSVIMSNPSGMQVSGLVIGGTFQPGAIGGAISAYSINSGQSSVILQGGSVAASGLITGNNIALTASSGNIGLINTADVNVLTANATGSINVNNTGALASFGANADNTVTLTNNGSVALAGNITGPSGVTMTSYGGSITGGGLVSTNTLIQHCSEQQPDS